MVEFILHGIWSTQNAIIGKTMQQPHNTTYCCLWVVTAPSEPATGWFFPPTKWRSDHTQPWPKHHGQTKPAQNLAGWSSVTNARVTQNYIIAEDTTNSWKHEQRGQNDRHLLSFGSELLVSERFPEGRAIDTHQLKTATHLFSDLRVFAHTWTSNNTCETVLTFERWCIWVSVVI